MIGKEWEPDALAGLMLSLQAQGAHNINLVTPTPHVDSIIPAVLQAKQAGLKIPIVYNTNGYETLDTLRRLEGIVDIYLPDLKYVSSEIARKYSDVENYFSFAGKAVLEMHRQCGILSCDAKGIAQRGLIVRHLVLPGSVDETRRVLDFLAENLRLQRIFLLWVNICHAIVRTKCLHLTGGFCAGNTIVQSTIASSLGSKM